MGETEFITACRELLSSEWNEVCRLAEDPTHSAFLDDDQLVEAIKRSVNARTKTYRYVLPTQVVAKLVDSELDCRCLQVARGGPGAFDARTVAHQVIVPFDRENEGVLGGSPEPYVNNPVRVPEVSAQFRDAQRDKQGWDDLCTVLDAVESNAREMFTRSALRQVLLEVYGRLATVNVVYPAPRRVSLDGAIEVIDKFTAERSGGHRFEAITAALFLAVGRTFKLFADVRTTKSNAADASAGTVADIECIDDAGTIIMAVEAKDRALTVRQVQDKIPGLRENKISEAFVVAGGGVKSSDEESIRELVAREFVSGQNIYVLDLQSSARVLLAVLGETGRRTFLELVGKELDAHCDIQHRRAWAELLAQL